MKKNNSLSSQLYLLSSILLFLLAIVSIVRMELNQTAIAGDPPTEPWVDGRVYRLETKEGESRPVYISTQGSECGVNEGEIKVSDSSIDRCDSKGRPYYLLEEVKEGQNTFQLQIPSSSEYTCDSWVAVESRNTGNVIARGKCTGAYSNEATYDNQGKNTTLWWKLKLIEVVSDGGDNGDGDSSGIKPLEQPDYAGFGTNEGDSNKTPESTPDLVPYTGSYTLVGQSLQFTRGFNVTGSSATNQIVHVATKNQGNSSTSIGYWVRSFLTNDEPSSLGLTNQNFYSIWYGIPGYLKNQDLVGIMEQNQIVAFRETNLSNNQLYQHNYLCMMVDSPDPEEPNGRVQESDEENNISCISKSELINGGSTAFSCENVTQIPRSECEALVDFYDSMNGEGWSYSNIRDTEYRWMENNRVCSWYQVGCANGKIVGIGNKNRDDLTRDWQGLRGTLPASIQNLTTLKYLSLRAISQGDIEVDISRMINNANLEFVRFDNARVLNVSSLSNLNLLTKLRISRIDKGDLPNLRTNNNLREYVFSCTNNGNGMPFSQLRTYIPLGIQTISVSQCGLTGNINGETGFFTNLKKLQLDNNQLQGFLPMDVSNITLESLVLNNNNLSGAVPNSYYLGQNKLDILKTFHFYGTNICLEGGSQGQAANWLREVESRDPSPGQVNPSPENATACAPTTSADLVPLTNTTHQNGVQFTSATNSVNVGVKNNGDAGASNFNIKGVIVAQPITTPAQFNTAYAISTNPKGLVNIETIGTTSNNPKLATMSLGSTNLSQHANKYMCIFVDGGDGNNVNGTVSESNENNNIGCRQIPVTDFQFVDLQPYTGVGASNFNYSGGIAFYTNSSNTISVGVKNHGNQSTAQLFQIKGVISQSAISTVGAFNNAYNSAGPDVKKAVSITGIGTGSTNNPKYIDMSFVANWAQHNGKYLCVFIDSALAVNESSYENNNIGCRQIPNNTQKPDLRGFTGSYSNKQYTYGAGFIDNRTLGFAVKNIGQNTSTGQFKVRAFLTNDSVTGVTSGNFIDKWNQSQVALRSEANYTNNISTNAIGSGSMVFSLPVSVTIKSYTNLCIKFDAESSLTGNIVETDEWNNMGCIQTSQFGAPDLRILTNTYNGRVYTKGLAKGSTVNQVGYAVKNIGQSATQTPFNIKIFFTNDDVSSVTSGNFFSKYSALPDSQKRKPYWSNNVPVGSIISNVENFDSNFNYNNYQNVCIKFDSENTLVGRIPESDEWNNFGCGRVVDMLR